MKRKEYGKNVMYMWKNESKSGKIKRVLLEKHRTKL